MILVEVSFYTSIAVKVDVIGLERSLLNSDVDLIWTMIYKDFCAALISNKM